MKFCPLVLERGLNRVVVEAFELDGGRSERSRTFTLRRVGSPRRGELRAPGLEEPPLLRKPLPRGGAPGRLRPLD